jgi:hypothetical protein
MNKEFQIGMNSLEVLESIIDNHESIRKVSVIIHEVGLNWSQKYKTPEEMKENFLEAYTGAKPTKKSINFLRKDFLNLTYNYLKTQLYENEVMSFVSKVEDKNGNFLHIPMMNFHLENDFRIEEIRKTINFLYPEKKGVLLNSGRHSHYYGNFLLDQKEWESFLGNFLIPFNLVHPGYIGYVLRYGYSTLRLTADNKFKPKIPEVFEIL